MAFRRTIMIKSQRLSVKKTFLIQIVVLAFFFAGCAIFQRPEPLFGLSKEVSPEKVSVVNLRRVYSGKANGVWVFKEGTERGEFTRKNSVLLLPGNYNFKVRSLVDFEVVQKGNITVKKPHYFNIPLSLQAGKRYELRRVRSDTKEKIEAREIP
jgi:hypothetical protein